MAEPWHDAVIVSTGLPPCPECLHPGDKRYAWGPFSVSHISVRTEGSIRWMLCCRCSKRFKFDFGTGLDSLLGSASLDLDK